MHFCLRVHQRRKNRAGSCWSTENRFRSGSIVKASVWNWVAAEHSKDSWAFKWGIIVMVGNYQGKAAGPGTFWLSWPHRMHGKSRQGSQITTESEEFDQIWIVIRYQQIPSVLPKSLATNAAATRIDAKVDTWRCQKPD